MPRRPLVLGGDHMEHTSANRFRRPGRFDVLRCREFMTALPARPDDLPKAIVAGERAGVGAGQVAAALLPYREVSLQQKALAYMLRRLGGAVEFASLLEADQTRLPTGNRASCNRPAVRSLPHGSPARNSSGPLDGIASSDPRLTRRLAAILAADIAGYSRLMNQNEEDTHCRATGIRHN